MLLRSDIERALLAFLRAAAASLEGVEVIEHASLEGDHAANGLAEVGVREVKAQTRDAERMMDGIFVGHHEPIGASLSLSERGLLRGTRVQRKPRTSSGTTNSFESAEEFRGCSLEKSLK